MMRLVTEHHPELVNQTHVHLGGELETENNYKEAEKHYVAGGDWKAAVNMWRGLESWEDAFRVRTAVTGSVSGETEMPSG